MCFQVVDRSPPTVYTLHPISFKFGIYERFGMHLTHPDSGVDQGSSRGEIEAITLTKYMFQARGPLLSYSLHWISFKLGYNIALVCN